jgi:hypothetical protein
VQQTGRASLAVSVAIGDAPAARLDAKMHASHRRDKPPGSTGEGR